MDTTAFKPMISWIHLHPEWGIFFAFLFSFLEAVALLGILIPGTLVMTVAGIFAGSGLLPLKDVILWSALGAFLGDYLSYGLGYFFRDNLKNVWPFRLYPKLLTKGSIFFHKHGGKSVFIGRFLGPVRPIIPLIAGTVKMPAKQFIPVDMIASLLWPPVYMLPGFIIGAASLALPPEASTRIIINLLILLGIICIFYWLLKLTFGHIISFVDKMVYRFWQFLKRHPRFTFLYNMLKNVHIPDDHSQLGLAIFALIFFGLFLVVTICVITHTGIYHINEPLYHLFRSAYSLQMEKMMLMVSYLGNPGNMMILWLIILIWLAFRRQWFSAVHWAFLGVTAAALGELVKHLVAMPRPTGLAQIRAGFSYPSGHVLMATTLYSYLAIIFARDRDEYFGWFCYGVATLLILLIVLSRLWLGAHWATDTLGGLFLGLTISFSVAISFRRYHRKQPHLIEISILTFVALVVISSTMFIVHFNKDIQNYTPVWPQSKLIASSWWKNGIQNTPLYRQDRFGHKEQTLTIQWLGNPELIEQKLEKFGWRSKQKSFLLHTIHYFGEKNRREVIPLFSAVYEGKSPVIVMTKLLPDQKALLVLRLWPSNVIIVPTEDSKSKQLLVGVVSYLRRKSFDFLINSDHHLELAHPRQNPLDILKDDLTFTRWKVLNYANCKRLPTLEDLDWDGRVLLIENKNNNKNNNE